MVTVFIFFFTYILEKISDSLKERKAEKIDEIDQKKVRWNKLMADNH